MFFSLFKSYALENSIETFTRPKWNQRSLYHLLLFRPCFLSLVAVWALEHGTWSKVVYSLVLSNRSSKPIKLTCNKMQCAATFSKTNQIQQCLHFTLPNTHMWCGKINSSNGSSHHHRNMKSSTQPTLTLIIKFKCQHSTFSKNHEI